MKQWLLRGLAAMFVVGILLVLGSIGFAVWAGLR